MLRAILIGLISIIAPFTALHAQDEPSPSSYTPRRWLRLPILMYHYISPLPEDADDYRRELTVEPAVFAAHLAFLAENDYTTVTMAELYRALKGGEDLPDKPVILSFDDGYRDHYEYAFPILQEYGFIGTFFVVTGFLDEEYPAHLNWSQVQEMAEAGMDIQSHSKQHGDLRQRTYDYLVYEMLGSYESLAAHLERPPLAFSFPGGKYDENALAVLASTDYRLGVTTEFGKWHDSRAPFTLRRLRVSGNLSVKSLAKLLGYAGE